MTPEEKTLLDNTYNLAKENNEMLRAIRRSGRISLAWKIFYWVLIIGLSVGAFHFFQNYLDLLQGVSGRGTDASQYAQQIKDLIQ